MEDKDWSSRWSKKKSSFHPAFWVLVAVLALVMIGLAWLFVFPPASP